MVHLVYFLGEDIITISSPLIVLRQTSKKRCYHVSPKSGIEFCLNFDFNWVTGMLKACKYLQYKDYSIILSYVNAKQVKKSRL